jgi:hypothetical protein
MRSPWTESRKFTKTGIKRLLTRIRSSAKGETFYIEYIKRTTGKRRRLYGQFGVKRKLKGKGHNFKPSYLHLMCVFDVKKKQYRFISLEHVVKVIWRETRYLVKGARSCRSKNAVGRARRASMSRARRR